MLAEDKVRFKGERSSPCSPTAERAAARGRRQGQGRLRGPAGGLRRRGGAEARRAAGQRVSRPELLHLRRATIAARSASATSRRASPRPTTSSRRRYQSSPIEHAPTETTGCIVVPEGNGRFTCYTNTQAMFFTLDNTALILQTCRSTSCAWSAARSAAASAARSTSSSSRSPSSPRSSPAGRSSSSTAARRRCRSPRRARPSASTSRTA